MNRNSFRASPAVCAFVEWAGPLSLSRLELGDGQTGVTPVTAARGCATQARNLLANLLVDLNIPRSRFVPTPVVQLVSFRELPLSYIWRARGMVYGELTEAGRLLRTLAAQLRSAVAAGDWQLAQALCFDVLAWGGERNQARGARPELRRLGAELCQYLRACDGLMRLDTAVLAADGSLAGVPNFGSMWVKIYAIMSGTPIYDSRVAGAIATLVETWRIQSGQSSTPLPPELMFPAVANRADRTVRRRYPLAKSPGSLSYTARSTPARWAGATVRLGWLIEELLQGDQDWRMAHALEAGLFMAGYDCSAINPPPLAAARRGLITTSHSPAQTLRERAGCESTHANTGGQ